MTDVASLDLCKELYELSGGSETLDSWHDTYFAWAEVYAGDKNTFQALNEYIPAYSLGYLLRKLPTSHKVAPKETGHLIVIMCGDTWGVGYGSAYTGYINKPRASADTPEDAACKLAIELIKSGVLKV